MKKALLLTFLFALLTTLGFSQTDKFWFGNTESRSSITTDKAVARQSFPKEFKLFNLNSNALRQVLFSIVDNQASRRTTIITLPNADGQFEQFEVFEASNFEPALQARYPEIRAFSGKGITDKYATLKLSISPQGIQTMVFRTEKENEFIEPYSQDHNVYAVFKSHRTIGNLPWTCTTADQRSFTEMGAQMSNAGRPASSAGQLKTMRLAQSCTAEYANYFGATSVAQVGLVLAAFNATLTRCNGCYEKDLALHLNLIANTGDVIYYNPATDPYAAAATGAGGAWNNQLQTTLTAVIGTANYDIGHLFGASGGGGNAGCIGCVCGTGKGSGFTSPADNIPQGDNFDIDYVVHEVGHQLGANHTYSFQNESGSGVLKEIGSGITIMGYAGITNQDVAPHSIDIYHEASIAQIQANLATKTCPITTDITAVNATPVIAPVSNYTIPLSTPFALTGSATDANAGDALTYCWEQNDNATTFGNNSVASPTKVTGPNFLSFRPTVSPTRTFPILATILAGAFTTGPLPGGDAVAKIEALSSVARTLNFRLTVRDNCPYSSTAPIKVGQTSFTDMVVTVSNTSGPFLVTQPNTNLSWAGGSTQTVTWDVAGSAAAPVSCANVKISISTDGGLTFPTVLAASTANDGTETVSIPAVASTTARIKVEAIGNIFFDISNTNFTITAAANGFTFNNVAATSVACGGATTATSTLSTTATGGFATPINLTATGNPAGTTVSFSVNPVTPGNSTVVTLSNTNTLAPGNYDINITGVAGAVTQSGTVSFTVLPGTAPAITTQPAPVTVCSGANAVFSVTAPGAGLSYQWQVSTGGPFSNIAGANSATYTATGVTSAANNNQYQVIVSTLCGTTTSTPSMLTVNAAPAITAQPADAIICAGNNNTFAVTATGTGLSYQWQESTTGCGGTFVNIPGATSASYTLSAITIAQNGYAYQCVISGNCAATAIISTCVNLSVSSSVGIVNQPTNVVACNGSNATFTVDASGTGVNYQWQVSTGGGPFTDIPGETNATLTLTGVTAALSGNQYQAVLTNSTCSVPSFTTPATLTINTLPAVATQPAAVTICAGADASFTAAGTGSNITYQWQVSTGGGPFTDIPGATAASYTETAATAAMNNNQYHVVISGACTPAAVSTAATLVVISPVAITAQPVSSATVCEGSDVTLTVTATSGGAPSVSYQWQVSTGAVFTNIPGATSASLTLTAVTAAMNGNQYNVVLSNATCTGNVASTISTLNVNALPAVTAAADVTNICTGTQVQLTATGADTYSWTPAGSVSDANIANPTANPSVDPSNPGVAVNITYTVTGTGTNGCENSSSVTVTANPAPVVTLTATPAVTNLVPAQTVLLKATVTPAGNFVYTWSENGVAISNTTDSLRVGVGDLGAYSVTVASPSGACASTSNIINVTDSATTHLYVYPNPNNGQFTVSYHNPGGTTAANTVGVSRNRNLAVYDSHGARVFSKALVVSHPYDLIKVDIRPAAAGIYILVLYDGSGNRLATERVIVHQ